MRALVVMLLLCGLCSCASSTYRETGLDGISKEITYTVLGSRQLKGVDINLEKGRIKLESGQGSAGDIAETLLNLSEIAKRAALVP